MKRSKLYKLLSLVLTVVMVFGLFPYAIFATDTASMPIKKYSDFLECLTDLEKYADQFVREHPDEDSTALIINYIRCGNPSYTSSLWSTLCGTENTLFTGYVAEKDEENGTTAGRLKKINIFKLPNGDDVEFTHMFASMDMSYHTGNQNTADLGSWAGDICDLVQLTQLTGIDKTSVDEMADEIRTNNDVYFLRNGSPDMETHSFGRMDLYGDLDSFYILKNISSGTTISNIMKYYFSENLNDGYRAKYFLENRFDGINTKDEIRDEIYTTYCTNEGISTLEKSYLPDGTNSDIRTACCYAFADYLYETSKDLFSNKYYKIFSNEASSLAPGVKQETKMALTADDKQIVYYLATADITRNDVNVYANYGDCDASEWKMTQVSQQMKAADEKYSNPNDTENYIPNYNAVASVNADFYYMDTGEPTGTLIIDGVIYNNYKKKKDGLDSFFGILKDGTPIIGKEPEWIANKDNLRDAVGSGVILIKDGKVAVPPLDDYYYTGRAPRTSVGITYDGKLVVMVLDGRQEPFSAGGNYYEIAQIMLDAGCVSAVNLDGGGSSTFVTKAEGTNEIGVVNRPSDGHERSVSSSLVVVSTAKPSNVFDHAVISSDYDYLTVGTSVNVNAKGVTATGGSIDLPEGSYFKLSDNSIGKLSDNGEFTASALGEVQVQLLESDGNVLGSKTLHVVEPDELNFTKSNINAVYGKSSELPLEASYKGNPVKINVNDVYFGYLKVSLKTIGEIDGQTVNTTVSELVADYPEAGTISGFNFTPKADGELRTLTIGAVLMNKMDEFQTTIYNVYLKTYQECKENGYNDKDAETLAQSASVNAALETATKTTIYMYRNDEVEFNFTNATGGNGLVAFKRDISNSTYNQLDKIFYLNDPKAPTKTSYTFAIDMSKVPVPENLTGLLYMLPGGDQEGKTAWDFLLQLAERISPLTTITVKMNLPEGFDVDYSSLRLANEFFKLNSTEVEGNTLILKFNFIEQTKPVNPSTANPLCVLSGLKLTPKDSAWDAYNGLDYSFSASFEYDIYAHFHILERLASQEEYQQKYGLYPYSNRENNPNDYGAHFADNIANITDTFSLQRTSREGWIRRYGYWAYYENNIAKTGIQKLPSNVTGESGEFWYDLGTDGRCKDKLTGMFEIDGKTYYSRFGVLASDWQSINAKDGKSYFYYFDKNDFTMYTGVRTIDGLTYTFNDAGQMTRGAFCKTDKGTKYFVAGESWFRRFITLEEGTYWVDVNGYVAYGNDHTVTDNVKDITWYHFDETTGLLTGLCKGFIDYKNELYYCDENGKVFYGLIKTDRGIIFSATQGKVNVNTGCYVDSTTATKGDVNLENGHYWCGSDGAILSDGFATINGETYYFENYKHAKGFTKIGDDYYIFNAGTGRMYKDATMWVNDNPYGIKGGMYYFDADGKMYIPDTVNGKKAVINENGKLYFTIDGVKMTNGLNTLDGEYYYANTSGQLAVNKTVWVAQKNDLISEKGNWYSFDKDGKMIKTGFVNGGDGYTYYYDDTVLALGFTKIGNDYYIFNAYSGKMYKDSTMWVNDNPYGIKGGMHYFDTDGKMFIPDTVNGKKAVINENGKLYFTIDGVKMTNGLNTLDGEYYYANTNGQLAVNQTIWVSQKNDLISEKGNWYAFDKDGKMIKTGFVNGGDGYTYYYNDTVLALGFTKIGDDYYIFNAYSGKMYKDATMWVNDNPYGIKGGMHYFDADGKMFIPDTVNGKKAVINENGKLYFTIDGVKMTNGLNTLDGEYYYANTNGELAVNKTVWVAQKNDLISEKGNWYSFDKDGKMIKTGFVNGGDGYTYYYDDTVLALGFTKIGNDYYIFNAYSGKMYKDSTMWVNDNPYGIKGGMHYFDASGKMFVPDTVNGKKAVINENGKLYFTIDGVKMTNGLNNLDGEYYYANTNGQLAVNQTIWVSQKNDLISEKGNWYAFDKDGKMIKTGFVNGGDGYTYYYNDTVLALGFTKIGDDYYIFNTYSGKMYKDAKMWVGNNDYGIVGGSYYFDSEGRMTTN